LGTFVLNAQVTTNKVSVRNERNEVRPVNKKSCEPTKSGRPAVVAKWV